MRRRWTLFLAGWLLVVGLPGCGQPTPSVSIEVAATVRSDPPVVEVTVLPGAEPGEKAPPAAMGTPTPPGAVALISPTQMIQEETVTTSPTIPTPSSPALQRLVMQAREDLAQRLSIEVDQIELVEISAVVWPDGGLGCPQPGMAYTQVQQEGMRIRLRAGKRIYSYHSGGGHSLFLCEQATTDE